MGCDRRNLPGGDSISQDLFALGTLLLNSTLVAAGLGFALSSPSGSALTTGCIMYVDDRVLFASDADYHMWHPYGPPEREGSWAPARAVAWCGANGGVLLELPMQTRG